MTRLILITALMSIAVCAAAEDAPRSISVSGTGSADVQPDRARIVMSIVSRDPSLSVAQNGASDVTGKVLAIIDDLDIDRSRVDTTGASVRPDYRYNNETREQELHGYIAQRQIKVEFRDLDNLSKVIEGAVAAGVNQVSEPQLFSSKQRDVYRQALENAAADARANAERLAAALGMSLGPVLRIDAGTQIMPMPNQRQAFANAMAVDTEGASYNPGDLSVHTTIGVEFELLVD